MSTRLLKTSAPVLREAEFCNHSEAFILHINSRGNRDQLRTSWRSTNPTMVMGVCDSEYYSYDEDLQSMRNCSLSMQWALLEK